MSKRCAPAHGATTAADAALPRKSDIEKSDTAEARAFGTTSVAQDSNKRVHERPASTEHKCTGENANHRLSKRDDVIGEAAYPPAPRPITVDVRHRRAAWPDARDAASTDNPNAATTAPAGAAPTPEVSSAAARKVSIPSTTAPSPKAKPITRSAHGCRSTIPICRSGPVRRPCREGSGSLPKRMESQTCKDSRHGERKAPRKKCCRQTPTNDCGCRPKCVGGHQLVQRTVSFEYRYGVPDIDDTARGSRRKAQSGDCASDGQEQQRGRGSRANPCRGTQEQGEAQSANTAKAVARRPPTQLTEPVAQKVHAGRRRRVGQRDVEVTGDGHQHRRDREPIQRADESSQKKRADVGLAGLATSAAESRGRRRHSAEARHN